MPPLKRIYDFNSFPLAAEAIGERLKPLNVTPTKMELQQSLAETMLLNPNADLSQRGRFMVKQEHKGMLLESLVKAVIGNNETLSPKDFDRVAGALSDGQLFEDGRPYPVDKILTPLPNVPGMEAGDMQGNYWGAGRVERPSEMGDHRPSLWAAEHNLITRILGQYALPAGKGESLEVGAGWGDFYWMAPDDFRRSMVSVEWDPNYLPEYKQRFPEADVRVGNIYRLGVPDGSYKNIVGFTPFSSLDYLDHAVAELWRVMQPGGRFFSFQDLLPNDEQVVNRLLARGLVPDPTRVLFFRTPKDRKQVADALTKVGEEFGGQAWKEYKKVFHRNTAVQNLYEYHETWLANELKYRGFKILHQNDDMEVHIGPRERRHASFCGHCGMDHNADIAMFHYGNPRGPFMEPHPSNVTIPGRLIGSDVVEKAIIWTTVAEKPKDAKA